MHKKQLFLLVLTILLMALAACSTPEEPEGSGLRDLADDFLIGYASASNFWDMNDSEIYQETARNEFNIMTPENQMKWEAIHGLSSKYTFESADQHVQFAKDNNMAVHGHTLIWHRQNPRWLLNGDWSRDELIAIMNDHIDTVVGHFAGDVLVWDVVNEAFEEDGSYRDTFWHRIIGPEYIDLAFEQARAADPEAKLIYNDYNVGWMNRKSDAVYEMVADMVGRGVPIDGVGFQMHLTESGVNAQSLADNMQRFADLGLEIYITEMDVRIPENPSEQDLENQARIYGEVLNRCLAQPACKALQVWGISDKDSWVMDAFPGTAVPLLFDDNYEAKPAYEALKTEFEK